MELNAGLIQLSQGIASNRFQGDELRSVLENLPGITRVILAGFRELSKEGRLEVPIRSIGEIREAAEQGRLNSELMIRVLEAGREEAEELASQIQFGLVDTLRTGRNELLAIVDLIEDSTGATENLGNAASSTFERVKALREEYQQFVEITNIDPLQSVGRGFNIALERRVTGPLESALDLWERLQRAAFNYGDILRTLGILSERIVPPTPFSASGLSPETADQTHPCLLYTSPSPRDS